MRADQRIATLLMQSRNLYEVANSDGLSPVERDQLDIIETELAKAAALLGCTCPSCRHPAGPDR